MIIKITVGYEDGQGEQELNAECKSFDSAAQELSKLENYIEGKVAEAESKEE